MSFSPGASILVWAGTLMAGRGADQSFVPRSGEMLRPGRASCIKQRQSGDLLEGFMRVLRTLAIGVFLTTGSLVSTGLLAETSSNPVALCETSSGEPGRLFSDIADIFEVPEAFDSVEGTTETVKGTGLGTTPPSVYAFASEAGSTQLRFFDGDKLVYTCAVNAIDFDPAVHSLSSVTSGNCDWQADRDLPMLTGIARLFAVPQRFREIAVGNPDILDVQPVTESTVYATGRAPGITDITALEADGTLLFRCPFMVLDAATYFGKDDLDDDMLCRDPDGRTARLRTGDTLSVSFPKTEPDFIELAVANPKIAELHPQSLHEYSISAVAAGVTNVIGLHPGGLLHHECLIMVE